jgi:hypothetical protein
MRATRIASTAAATAAALGVVALTGIGTPASAADGDSGSDRAAPGAAAAAYAFSVTPSSIAAGGQVTLRAGGCPGSATVTSAAFPLAVVQPGQTTRTTVGQRVTSGAVYDVKFVCNDGQGSGSRSVPLTVMGTGGAPTTSSTSLPARSASPVTSVSPVVSASPARGVRGGLGGSIGGMDTTEIAAGAALVALAAAGSFYAVRRRSAGSRRH